MPPRKKKAKAKEAPRGRARVSGVGSRLTRTQIGTKSGIDRGTLTKYLSMQGAPDPDEAGRFDYGAVLRWVQQNSKTAHGSAEIRSLKEQLLRTEAEAKAFDLGVKKGAYVEREKIEPTIAAFMASLTADLQAKFELELPAKYEGKTLAERTELNAAAVDFVLKRLRDGAKPLVRKEAA
jgi:hypothetical protein